MTPGEMASVLTRLHALERRVLLSSALAVAALAALLLFGLRSPAESQPQAVRAQAIEVTDAAGHTRITLDAVGGKPAVWLYDTSGRRRIGLTVTAFGVPEISLHGSEPHARLLLRVGAERAAELRMTDALGRLRVGLWVDYKDDPGLWMFDRLARPRIGLKVSAGEPRLWLFENPTGRLTFVAP